MLKLEFNPTKAQLNKIKRWLKEEKDQTDDGLYCNWYMIERFFERGQLIVGLLENSPTAFMTYNQNGSTIIFDLMEVKPSHRKKGLGKEFVFESISRLKSKEIKKIEVDCINEGSGQFCKQIGFVIDNNPIVTSSRNYKFNLG
jgi:predicted GNAT family acetyltransferase